MARGFEHMEEKEILQSFSPSIRKPGVRKAVIYTVKTYRRFREVCWVWISQTKLIKVKFIAK